MNFRLKTSKYTADQLEHLKISTNLTPNILARLAVSLSLKGPALEEMKLPDTNGLEFNRHTLTGEYDYLFKALIAQHEDNEVTDEDYFPKLFNFHLERGIRLLVNEYKYAGNYEKFITNLLTLD